MESPLHALRPIANWDSDDAPSRSAAELVAGLKSTWPMLTGALGLETFYNV